MFLEWEETYGPRTKKGNGWFYKTSQRSDDGYQVNGVRVYRVIGGKKEYMGQGAKLIYYETIVSDEPQVGVVAVLDPSMNEDKAAEIILAHDDDDGRFSLHTRTADQDAEVRSKVLLRVRVMTTNMSY